MRAVILLLVLQAMPARWTPSSMQRILTTPIATGERSLTLRTPQGTFQARWLHDARGDHLAVLDPLGAPMLLVRSDGDRLGLQLRGRPEVVAQANEAIQLATDGAITLADVGALLLGRFPEGTTLQRIHGGWRAQRGPLMAELELDGTLRWARWRDLELRAGTLQGWGQRVEVRIGEVRPRALPRSAFEVAAGPWIPIESLARSLTGVSDP